MRSLLQVLFLFIFCACHSENINPTLNSTKPELYCADNLEKQYIIKVVKFTSLHAGIVLPIKYLNFNNDFKHYSYVAFNWGDEGFYKAGSSILAQALAAPGAMFLKTPAVVYAVPIIGSNDNIHEAIKSCKHPGCNSHQKYYYDEISTYFKAVDILLTQSQLVKLSNIVMGYLKKDAKGQVIKIGTSAADFSDGYSPYGQFYKSSQQYQGFKNSCNGMLAEILSEALPHFGSFNSLMAEPLFKYLDKKKKENKSCFK